MPTTAATAERSARTTQKSGRRTTGTLTLHPDDFQQIRRGADDGIGGDGAVECREDAAVCVGESCQVDVHQLARRGGRELENARVSKADRRRPEDVIRRRA